MPKIARNLKSYPGPQLYTLDEVKHLMRIEANDLTIPYRILEMTSMIIWSLLESTKTWQRISKLSPSTENRDYT